MKVVIETPKWSFTKYGTDGGRPVPEFVSPLPNIFNYGYVEGTKAADGMEEDAIVLGPTLKAGDRVEARRVGVVRFLDRGLKDDKIVCSMRGRLSASERASISAFFTVYAAYKTLRYALAGRPHPVCRYLGFFEE